VSKRPQQVERRCEGVGGFPGVVEEPDEPLMRLDIRGSLPPETSQHALCLRLRRAIRQGPCPLETRGKRMSLVRPELFDAVDGTAQLRQYERVDRSPRGGL